MQIEQGLFPGKLPDAQFTETASGKSAGEQVEALFVSLLLKEMRQSGTEGGLFPGDSTDTYGGIFDQYLGEFIAESGGLGLADAFNATLPQTSLPR